MYIRKTITVAAAAILLMASAPDDGDNSLKSELTTITADGITIYGEEYSIGVPNDAPAILLFHQAGSNGRGEYKNIIPWLNGLGYRVYAWDQRAGGSHFGSENRTVKNMPEGTPKSYCDARPDLQAAHDYVIDNDLADEVIIWGSSYSAALVFGLAADNPDTVSGIFSFSPATGGAMADCRASRWIEDIETDMVFIGRPASEMARASSQQQAEMFKKYDYKVDVVENGVHGSSMLDDERTGHDMSRIRKKVKIVLGYTQY